MIETTKRISLVVCDVEIYWTCCQVGLVRFGERSPVFFYRILSYLNEPAGFLNYLAEHLVFNANFWWESFINRGNFLFSVQIRNSCVA